MRNKRKYLLGFIIFIGLVAMFSTKTFAAPTEVDLPSINVSVGGDGTPQNYVDNVKLFIIFTILALAPSFVIMITSFTRIVVVFSFLKSALGAQQSIPNQLLLGLALFLTIFIMQPVFTEINETALKPYAAEEITQDEAIDLATKPLKNFMLKQTRQKDLELFIETAKLDADTITKDNIPLHVVVPAFAISELKTAFQIGFLLFLPFLVVDMVVASVLMSMGMFMLPPVMIALPFKLLLFVMVDGWYLMVKSLVLSFS